MRSEDDEVDEIHHELSEDNRKLVPADEHSADIARCHLADIHRTDGRRHSYTEAAKHTVGIEHI